MPQAKVKTTKNDKSVAAYLKQLEGADRRADAEAIVALMKEVTGEEPKMWGDAIVGFGSYHYAYDSGREGDWMLTGFAARKQQHSLYVMCGFEPIADLLPKLGKHKTGSCCLYFKRLSDLHLPTLKKLIKKSVSETRKRHKA